MSIVRVGTTKKYSDNWDNIFGGNGRVATKKKVTKVVKNKPVKKKVAKKPAKKKK